MPDTIPQSIMILGRQPTLGLAELESLYGADAVSMVSSQAAGLSVPANKVDFGRLGGSTRLCKLLTELPGTDWKNVEKYLAKTIPGHLQYLPEGKLKFGLSAIGLAVSPGKLNASGLTLKKVIRAAGRSVRLVPNPETELNTAQVLHNNLTGPLGWELVAIATNRKTTLLAQTVSVQDIDSYTLRDRGRPKRDARVGMLPPKLAQVLINLASGQVGNEEGRMKNVETVVLDPFCGTGVLLQEAMLMGYSVYGTDLEPRMVDYSRANLDWLVEHWDNLESEILLEPGDATSYQWNPRPDFVAGETYLGRPFTDKPSAEMVAQTSSEVNLILKKFLINLHTQLQPGTRLCLAVPAWNTQPISDVSKYRSMGQNAAQPSAIDTSGFGSRFKHLPLIDQISDLGYNRVSLEHVRDEQLLYYREDQIVARQLLVLTRN